MSNDLATNKVVRTLSGRVVSDKMDKTVTVLVERKVKHPLIGKVIRRSNKFHAHDETNECKEGDLVVIEETRPLSKTKTWKVSKVVTKSTGVKIILHPSRMQYIMLDFSALMASALASAPILTVVLSAVDDKRLVLV